METLSQNGRMNLTNQNSQKGILLALVGVIILSPDSLLVRLLDVSLHTLIFWRGLFMFLCLAVFIVYSRNKGLKSLYKTSNKETVLMSIGFASSTFLFVSSLLSTSVAHTLLIVGTSPIFSAIFALYFLREKLNIKAWFTIVIIVIALFFVIQQKNELVSLRGDFYALLSSVIMGFIFVYVRKHHKVDLMLALSYSGIWMALVSMFFEVDLFISVEEILILCLLGCLVGIAFSMITLSARYIPAPIAGMFMPLETVIGVLLVWFFIGEELSIMTVVGGGVIILCLVYISYLEINQNSGEA